MSDLHIHILRLVAHRAQGELDNHDADHAVDSASGERRRHLKRTAVRKKVRLAAAQARRRESRLGLLS